MALFWSYPNGFDNLFDMDCISEHIVITSSRSAQATSAPWLTIPNVGYVEDKEVVSMELNGRYQNRRRYEAWGCCSEGPYLRAVQVA